MKIEPDREYLSQHKLNIFKKNKYETPSSIRIHMFAVHFLDFCSIARGCETFAKRLREAGR
jgi:hypothetical protein